MDFSAKYAKCPFYGSDKDITISCNEGVCESQGVKLVFPNSVAKKRHKGCFCDYKFENCPMFQMLAEKYTKNT